MGRIRWLLGGLGEFYLFLFSFPSLAFPISFPMSLLLRIVEWESTNANATYSAGGAVTAMGVTADLIKVIQRVS